MGGAQRDLDLLGTPLAHQQAVVLPDVLDDRPSISSPAILTELQ
jgi:hypothetical protein